MNKLKIGLALLLLASIVVYNLVMFISQETCSDYSCPSGYERKDNSDKVLCKDSVCKESDDKDTCCNKSVDCEGSWSDFGECSLECGGGTQTRTYNITTQPQYGGTPCPDTPESQSCNTRACATCSSYQCPEGYIRRTDIDNSCNDFVCDIDDRDTCCEAVVSTDTELPICADVMEPNKVPPDQGFSGEVGNLQACSDFCSLLPSCRSFAYSEIDRTQVPSENSEIRNCFIGTSTDSVPPSGILTQPWYSFSFYPKCQME